MRDISQAFTQFLLNNVCDRACNSKYRPKVKPTVMGIYEVERIVAKRVRGRKTEYLIHWQNYSPSENTWEPAKHLPEDLIAAFENRSVNPIHADERRERLSLLFENHHLTARCAASDLSWVAVGSPGGVHTSSVKRS